MTEIDLNADLGEGFGPSQMGDDKALLSLLSSANVACGFHAGDPAIMDRTVREALARSVDVGAHVGFPDLQGFGRRAMQIEPAEMTSIVAYQLGALAGIARRAGHCMTHMSFHGALGNLAAADAALADILVRAVAEFDPTLTLLSSHLAHDRGRGGPTRAADRDLLSRRSCL
jgi:5-oxoprolinase (ATP-hydrolysing) subunit A